MAVDLSKLEAKAREIGKLISRAIDDAVGPGKAGFALFMFDYGEGGNMTWLSSARREDAIKAMREWLAKVEAEGPGARG